MPRADPGLPTSRPAVGARCSRHGAWTAPMLNPCLPPESMCASTGAPLGSASARRAWAPRSTGRRWRPPKRRGCIRGDSARDEQRSEVDEDLEVRPAVQAIDRVGYGAVRVTWTIRDQRRHFAACREPHHARRHKRGAPPAPGPCFDSSAVVLPRDGCVDREQVRKLLRAQAFFFTVVRCRPRRYPRQSSAASALCSRSGLTARGTCPRSPCAPRAESRPSSPPGTARRMPGRARIPAR
jgi:hypothetical protein